MELIQQHAGKPFFLAVDCVHPHGPRHPRTAHRRRAAGRFTRLQGEAEG
jgi:hypothetical protein